MESSAAVLPGPDQLASRPWWARLVSYLFHPLFIPAGMTAFLVFVHPVYHLLMGRFGAMQAWLSITLNTVLYPALLVFLLWRLKFISGIQLRTQRERIIPLVANIFFYFWAWYVSRNVEVFPAALRMWLLGIFLCSCAAMFTNIFMKQSLHTLGWGGVIGFCLVQQGTDTNWPPLMLPVILVLAGLVGSARLALNAHKPGEVYAGYLSGILCMLAAALIAA